MNIGAQTVERLRSVIRRHGIFGTFLLVIRTINGLLRENSKERRREWEQQLEFDKTYGVDTAIKVPSSALRPPDPRGTAALHAVAYQPTSVEALHQILQSIPARLADFTFIDIGAGKGRALLIASHYPFRRIIGVEFSPHLAEIAQRNIAVYQDPEQRCHAIECVCIDASQYPLPREGNLLLYLYNPFGEPVMRAFLEVVARGVGDREIWLVYANPVLRYLLDEVEFLSPVQNGAGLSLYRAVRSIVV